MDGLLKEIRCKDEAAASVLEQAGLRADSDLQLLTLHNLGLLFPGVENVKLRRKIFYIIHKQKPIDVLIEEFKDFIPHESLRAALTENGVLVDYLKMLKEMKTQMNNDFLDRHISLLEDFRKSQPSQDQDKDEIMDILLKEIRRKDEAAASVLEHAGLRADSDLQLLTVQEAGELFPGVENFKRIRKIFDIIQTQKPIDILIKEFKDFIPHESLRAALTENGVLTNYLKMLKETKIQVNKVQDFLDAHINLLEDFRKSQPSQDQDKGSFSSSDNSQTGEPPQIQQGSLSSSDNSQTSDPPQIQQDITASSAMMSPPSPTSTPDHPKKRSGSLSSSDNSQTGDPPQIQQDIIASSAMMSPPSPTSTPDHPKKRKGSLSSSDNSQTSDPPQIQQDITASSAMMSPPSPTSTPDHPKKRSGSLSSSDNSQTGDPPQIQDIIASSAMMSPPSPTSTPDHPKKRKGSLSSSDNSQTGEPPQIQQDTSTSSAMMSPPSPTSTPDHPEKRSGSLSSSHNSQTGDPPQTQQAASSALHSSRSTTVKRDHPEKRQATLKYKMVISGKTFNAHQQILDKVKSLSEDPDLNLIKQEGSDQNCQAIIVFCPIASRMGTDIDAAMTQVTGSQPVILVLMHHTHEPKHLTLMKIQTNVSNVVSPFHIFYHETVNGLLQCQQNNSAISEIRDALLKHADIQTITDTTGKTQNVAAKSSNSGGSISNSLMRIQSFFTK
ncbi:uncharacterized protein LOC102078051 isoform X4 [Oreochromis niloticus]|uniref:uncharacterized protein LOC102078051 isoform X4 n=1 Tax=Oreochromis niloticus TaxID=8128 RepID=UPI000DF213D6|nr:uncharacterized protein LOC102078051 isoform X4 [Oreochromis niloticus]